MEVELYFLVYIAGVVGRGRGRTSFFARNQDIKIREVIWWKVLTYSLRKNVLDIYSYIQFSSEILSKASIRQCERFLKRIFKTMK